MAVNILEVDDVMKDYVSKDNLSTEDNVEGNEYMTKTINFDTQKVDICYHGSRLLSKGIRYEWTEKHKAQTIFLLD